MRAVLDTNVLVGALIKPTGSVGAVLDALRDGRYVALFSEATLEELVDVLARPRLREKYGIADDVVETMLRLMLLRGEEVRPQVPLSVCRDPKDDKFLEVALEGQADVLVTGDEDLLVLDPFGGVSIVSPGGFLARLGPD